MELSSGNIRTICCWKKVNWCNHVSFTGKIVPLEYGFISKFSENVFQCGPSEMTSWLEVFCILVNWTKYIISRLAPRNCVVRSHESHWMFIRKFPINALSFLPLSKSMKTHLIMKRKPSRTSQVSLRDYGAAGLSSWAFYWGIIPGSLFNGNSEESLSTGYGGWVAVLKRRASFLSRWLHIVETSTPISSTC